MMFRLYKWVMDDCDDSRRLLTLDSVWCFFWLVVGIISGVEGELLVFIFAVASMVAIMFNLYLADYGWEYYKIKKGLSEENK